MYMYIQLCILKFSDSDSNGTTPVDIDDAVPVTWTILFIGALIILSLCTIVMTYFVVRTYNAPGESSTESAVLTIIILHTIMV